MDGDSQPCLLPVCLSAELYDNDNDNDDDVHIQHLDWMAL